MPGFVKHKETYSTGDAQRIGLILGLRTFILKILLSILAVYILTVFCFGVSRAQGNEMYPNIKDGDLCISFLHGSYRTDDVVIYLAPDGKKHLGRVAAIPGDSISIRNEQVVLNGITKSEEIMYPTYGSEEEVNVGSGEYFILNDYRLDSSDSREFGAVDKENIYGKLIFILRRRGF